MISHSTMHLGSIAAIRTDCSECYRHNVRYVIWVPDRVARILMARPMIMVPTLARSAVFIVFHPPREREDRPNAW
jgi:hypothetical protein